MGHTIKGRRVLDILKKKWESLEVAEVRPDFERRNLGGEFEW